MFGPLLEKVFAKETKGAGGYPPYDFVMIFSLYGGYYNG